MTELLGYIMKPSIPYLGNIPGGNMTPGRQIIIEGMVPQNSEAFGINLAAGTIIGNPRSDTPFHFNPRFQRGHVVRNALQNMVWGVEETNNGMPFQHQMSFEIDIRADQNNYMISVNNNHFCDFQRRLPLTDVNTLTIEGSVIINSIKFLAPQTLAYNTPAPPAQPSVPMLLINPGMPLVIGLPNDFCHGKSILLSGTPTAATRFTINLQEGLTILNDIGLHFDVRMKIGPDTNKVVRKNRTGKRWGQEERAIPFFPFVPNVPFEMIISYEDTCFKVALNNQHFVEFMDREKIKMDILNISGDIRISQVRFQ